MSRRFIESFFPAVTSIVPITQWMDDAASLPWLYLSHDSDSNSDILAIAEDKCHREVVLPLSLWPPFHSNNNGAALTLIQVRNPILLLWAIVGAIYGIHKSAKLWHVSATLWSGAARRGGQSSNTDESSQPAPTATTERTSLSPQTLLLWSMAYAFFAGMNVVAIPLHCLMPACPLTTNVPRYYPTLWTMDTYFTGVFSSAIVFAMVAQYSMPRQHEPQKKAQRAKNATVAHKSKVAVWSWALWCIVAGGHAIYTFWSDTPLNGDATLALELWYLLPLCMAAAVVTPSTIIACIKQPHLYSKSALVGCIAIAWAILGLILDAPLCHGLVYFMPRDDSNSFVAQPLWKGWLQLLMLDSVRAPAIAFGACDLAFYGLWRRLEAELLLVPCNELQHRRPQVNSAANLKLD